MTFINVEFMGSFFKTFFASLLAIFVFALLVFFLLASVIGGIASGDKPKVKAKTVLVLNLGQLYKEQVQDDFFSVFTGTDENDIPGLYDVVRLLDKAAADERVSGILIQAKPSPNGFAASAEIRNALIQFRKSGKFVIAHTDVLTQRSYAIANVADKIYVNPQGFVEWFGFSVDYAFLKGTLDKLDIEPQIFYAGKFKSATEPLRSDKMTEENKLQTTVWLNDLYADFLVNSSEARKIDTAQLKRLADEGKIARPEDALTYKLIDGLKYDDEVKDEIKSKLGLDKYHRINFMTINAYRESGRFASNSGDQIALIYAEGDIVDGKGSRTEIGGENYRSLIRKARLDRNIKAIVLRVNSGGGSALASENIWRELVLAKKDKPVIVSFGDVAASGGYYIACAADSIFAQPNTITGSIGVFGIVPNMEAFFKNKLGVTFDGVKTGPYADMMTVTRPLNENEKRMIQSEIDNIYTVFKQRVADGRKKDTAYVDSIAQGRVWTGLRAKEIGLVDRFGSLDDAIASAARMAKLEKYQVKEYPETGNIFDDLLGKSAPLNYTQQIKEEIGEEHFKLLQQLKKVKQMTNTVQARIPFEFFIH